MIRHIKHIYAKWLRKIDANYKLIISLTGLTIALGLGIVPLFKSQFIPNLHEGHYIMHMTAVPGTSLKESLRIGDKISASIREIPGVKSVAQWVGRAPNAADTFGTHYSEVQIEMGSLSGEQQRSILTDIRELMAGEDEDNPNITPTPGISFAINTFLTERIEETISGYTASFVVNLHGPNLDTLDQDARAVAQLLSKVEGATDITLQSPPGTPELSIRLSPERLALWGIQAVDVLENIQAAFEGVQATQVYDGNRVISVSVMFSQDVRDDLREIGDLPLKNPDGKILHLRDVATIQQENGRSKILHLGAKRIQTVTCNIEHRDIQSFAREVKQRLHHDIKLHAGNFATFTGAAEAENQSREDLIVHSLLAGVGIFLVLYIALGSIRNLALTFINLPFALIGGVIATMFTGGWLSLGSLVGFVTLFGITLRNSIMLVSHYQHLIDVEGCVWNLETAIRGSSERLPSILMTALVTGLGLLPLAAASGQPGREIEGPMAMIIVGGLITSTILNLLILPAIMLHFGKFEKTVES